MSKLFSLIRRAPKHLTAVALMVAVAIIVPAAVFAWGPSRPTYTYEQPADHVTFDSITDNPNVGDERNFVRIREDVTGTTYGDNVTLQPGHTYSVMVYYHNNAATNLDYAAGSTNYNTGVGVAKNVLLRMEMPGTVNAGATANINGYISASNATPGTVWDSATATNSTSAAETIRYVANSAKVTSNGAVNGATLPDSLFTTGTPLGYDSLNGVLPGCNQFAGYVIFDFTVDQPNFTVQKQVSVDGGKTWTTNATTTAGSTVQYRVIYTNTGTTEQDNVVVSDQLPTNVSYVPSSTYIANSVTNGQYQLTSEGITTNGLNIGAYAPQGNAYLKFSAKIADESALACGINTLVNSARVNTSNGYKDSTATVTVTKTCSTPVCTQNCTPPPIYTCSALTASLVSGTEYKFNGTASASNGASIVNYVFNFGDGASQTVTNPTGVLHTYATTGATYTASLTVNMKVNGVDTAVTSVACNTAITVGQPPTPPVTPPELPHTGASDGIVTFLGLGALVASVIYYVRSRRLLV